MLVHKSVWYLNLYKEPWDMWLMINDYLTTVQQNKDIPTIPWLLLHLGIRKEQFREILSVWDAYSAVLSDWLLKIEDILLSMWLKSEISSKILPLYLKNYHWYTEKTETTEIKKKINQVNIVVKPAIPDDIDNRIIDVEDAEILDW